MMEEENKIRTSTVTISKTPEGFLLLVILQDAVLDVEEIKENQAAIAKLMGDEPVYQILDARNLFSIPTPGRQYYNENPPPNRKALAYVTDKVAMRLLYNVLVRLFIFKMPVKMFESIEEAKQWLSSQRDKTA